MQTRPNGRRLTVRGELALAVAVAINSFAVAATVYAGLGISPVSSFPYAVSLVFPFLTLGTWTYLFQGALVLTLMLLRRQFVPSYLFSFVVGFVFGTLLDVYGAWLPCLPDALPWRILYFALSCPVVALGIALSNRCLLPIIPTDLFARDLAQILGKPYPRVKMTFDLTAVALSVLLTAGVLGQLQGIGAGTVIGALTYGPLAGVWGKFLDKRFTFVSVLAPQGPGQG
ncbi:MAG TPA: hypothetical protein H9846_09980 [Candidatus Gemmiger excrementipullorum]|uniref:YitT family protein n=1 Tax=Candidatus Gemmiger excrementipullorum TaxID=2838610 RepID=A0A9D2BVM7_9FIRM|nr:hypothetical protein [Candidatus Gemmiger excrementipullorum]